ncbi:energy transducer TonB [Mucilaginibacter agri]|uniref:TonB C-terminal domain-containing protein n=1 Tax=Mucilaginibacter agri TaxID=2695265 RepID=A0A965ZJY0_9SPHI|nr:energy transducer TonB [Mucilaginibacter agri]NCD71443.1 hypothetical protein [Mucilaginibacter agri]
MPEDITSVKLKFSCQENWNAMQPVEGGRNCDTCQKKVYDFTNSKADEFRRILAENNNNVCGRFTVNQTVYKQQLFPFWKKWVSAAMVLIGFSFWGERSVAQGVKQGKQKIVFPPPVVTGDVEVRPVKKIKQPSSSTVGQSEYLTGIVGEPQPEFVGGDAALSKFLTKNIRYIKGTPNGRVIASFVISPSGILTDIKIIRSLTPAADNEVIRVLKLSPKWTAGKFNGKSVAAQYYLPVSFSEK